MENKANNYRQMLMYLNDLGADLVGHEESSLARTSSADFGAMNKTDLIHYQRVLEATIDHKSPLMNKQSLRDELTEVVRERFLRGGVEDKVVEARSLRARTASLDVA